MLVLHRPIGAAVYPSAQHDPALAAALQASLAEQQRHSAATAPDSRMRAALVESLEVQSLMAAAAPLSCWNRHMIAIFHETKRPVLDACNIYIHALKLILVSEQPMSAALHGPVFQPVPVLVAIRAGSFALSCVPLLPSGLFAVHQAPASRQKLPETICGVAQLCIEAL